MPDLVVVVDLAVRPLDSLQSIYQGLSTEYLINFLISNIFFKENAREDGREKNRRERGLKESDAHVPLLSMEMMAAFVYERALKGEGKTERRKEGTP